MNLNSKNFKFILGIFYLLFLSIGLFFLFRAVDLQDLTNYDFIRSKSEVVLTYKTNNFIILSFVFFIFSIIWVLLLGFASPILFFSGYVFGKFWGLIIILSATTIGASLLYLLAKIFFSDFINKNIGTKFSKLRELFNRNEFFYFLLYRFIGGGGIPYAIQNVLPVLFNMSIKNYFFATFLGSGPSMFITVALGSGIEKYIDEHETISFFSILSMQEIYLPILGFLIILVFGLIIKNIFFKDKINNAKK